jgi:hypothetical protein
VLKRLMSGLAAAKTLGSTIDLEGTLGGDGPVLLAWDDTAGILRLIVGSLHSPARTIELPSERQRVVYRAGPLGDRLEVDGETLKIPFGRGKEVKAWIAAAHVRSEVGASRWRSDRSAMALEFEAPDATTMSWIEAFLEPDEAVLALLATGDSASIASEWLRAEIEVGRWFMLTDRRTMLVAVSPFGEAAIEALANEAIELERSSKRTHLRVSIAGARFRSTLLNQGRFETIAELGPLDSGRRLRRAASLLVRRSGDTSVAGDQTDPATLLLDLAKARDPCPSDEASTLYLSRRDQDGDDWVPGLAGSLSTLDVASMTDWVDTWMPPAGHATAIARSMSELGADPHTMIALLRPTLDLASRRERDGVPTIELEIEFCDCLLRGGDSPSAISIAESRLFQLPAIEAVDILSGSESDLVRHFWLRATRVRLLEILTRSRNRDQSASATIECCRTAPLDAERHRLAIEIAEGDARQRLRHVLDLLAATGLERRSDAATPVPARALSEQEFEILRHQLARRKGVLASIYGVVASATPQDASTLRDCAEQATPDRYPSLFEALSDGSKLLGMPMPSAFIANGQCRLAATAHERPDRFVVVGGDHLVEDGPRFLDDAELRFLIGCQLADLRLGHVRATSAELRSGAVSKAVGAASLLPYLGSLSVVRSAAGGMMRIGSFVEPARPGRGSVGGGIDRLPFGGRAKRLGGILTDAATVGVGKLKERQKDPIAEAAGARGELGVRTEDLLAEHRVFQLTSDRFGLLLAGCPRAAIRAMFLTRSELADELAEANRLGLPECLLRTDDDGRLVHPYLAVRVAALLAFYLSDDYRSLEAAAAG